MFVPAPHRASNGTTNREFTVSSRSRASTSLSVERVYAQLIAGVSPVITSTNKGVRGSRSRASMQSGYTGAGTRPTSYESRAFDWASSGQAVKVWHAYQGTSITDRRRGEMQIGVIPGQSLTTKRLWWDYRRDYGFLNQTSSVIGIANKALVSNLQNRTIAEARDKARRSDLDAAEALVDLDKSFLMVARRASQLARTITALKAGRFRDAARILGIHRRNFNFKTAAQAWLEYQYGWSPLVADIQDSVNFVNKNLLNTEFTVTRRIRQDLVHNTALSPYYVESSVSQEAFATCEMKLAYRVNDSKRAFMASLGIENPIYAVWVRVPMSFVADWLIPVSTWLRACSAGLGLTYITGYLTTRTYFDCKVDVGRLPPNTGANFYAPALSESDLKVRARGLDMKRTPYTSPPGFFPYVRFPLSSVRRATSAVALVTALSRT